MSGSAQGLFTSSLPELYERFLVEPLFRPFAEELLRLSGIRSGERLLDVACGTGVVGRIARAAVPDLGRMVGVDASPAMIALGRHVAPAIDFREGDAAHLPVGAGEEFDVVTCHQGLQFFPDRPAALREMRRVMTPGGRVAIGTWRDVPDIPLIGELQLVAERHLGSVVDHRHSLGDPHAMRRLMTEAGFAAINVETVTHSIRMPDPSVFLQLNAMALVGMSPAGKAMSEEQRQRVVSGITADSADAAGRYVQGTDLVFDLMANIGIARS
jgi:ubiquinone/menaquinone biosynthesis C-methylase UbiE